MKLGKGVSELSFAPASDELALSLHWWRHLSQLKQSRKLTFSDMTCRDTAMAKENLLTAMTDMMYWKDVANYISAGDARG